MQKQYDVILEPYDVIQYRVLDGTQVEDWGFKYINVAPYLQGIQNRVIVFVLDTAGEFVHPDLIGNTRHDLAKNFSDAPTMADIHGHATHCAGIIGAVDNVFGIIGINPRVVLVPVKVLNDSGAGSYSGITAGINYVANLTLPADLSGFQKIISMSLGGSSPDTAMENALKLCKSKGIITVAAAGNSGKVAGKTTVGYPARYDSLCIAVASLSNTEKSSSFSSAGSEVDVSAPGENIYSTHKDGTYARLSGTSMATPQVAGLLSLLVSHWKTVIWNQDVAETFITKWAKDLGASGFDWDFGSGAIIADPYFTNSPVASPPPPPPPVVTTPITVRVNGKIGISCRELMQFDSPDKNSIFNQLHGYTLNVTSDVVINIERNSDLAIWMAQQWFTAYLSAFNHKVMVGSLDVENLTRFSVSERVVVPGYGSQYDIALTIFERLSKVSAFKVKTMVIDNGYLSPVVF